MSFCIDSKIENADWTKKKWDLPEYKSEEFFQVLKRMGMTLEHFKTLPVYKWAIKSGNIKE
jgi:hypothetical protein